MPFITTITNISITFLFFSLIQIYESIIDSGTILVFWREGKKKIISFCRIGTINLTLWVYCPTLIPKSGRQSNFTQTQLHKFNWIFFFFPLQMGLNFGFCKFVSDIPDFSNKVQNIHLALKTIHIWTSVCTIIFSP